MSQQEVVIVGKDGKEHVFPAGFDPKRAASIVKQRATTPREPGLATIGDQIEAKRDPIVDVGIGAAKGVGNTLFGLGKLVRDYTPIGRISDAIQPGAFNQRPPEITPTNTAQQIGYTGEQVGEFFVPLSKVAQLGKAGQVARMGVQTLAQSGDHTAAGVSMALSAVPVGKLASSASKVLRRSAEKTTTQALGATKEWAKVEATKLAPGILERGVKGSRQAMLDTAKAQTKTIGKAIEEVIEDAAARGTIVDGNVARASIQAAKQALMVPTQIGTGPKIAIEGAQRAIQKLDRLDTFVEKLGPAIPIEDAQRVKMAWDKIVSKAGLYGPKATSSATDNAEAWAIREAAGSFRALLANASPDLATLNKEFAFWGGLRNVLKETIKRTQAQRGGLTDAVRGAGGAVVGATVGGPLGAGAGQFITQQLSKAVASPWWKTTVSAPMKNALADALASGHTGKVLDAMKKITAAMPAQVRTAQ